MADVREMLTRKAGPLPVWAWTAISAAGFVVFMSFKKGKTPQPPGAGTGPGGTQGDFKSSTSSTNTDANGNVTTTQYQASGAAPFGIPGYLTQAAYPMPFSGGDIYNNQTVTVPQSTDSTIINLPSWEHPQPVPVPPPQQTTPPAPPAPPPPDTHGIRGTWTVTPGDNLWTISKRILASRWDRAPTNAEINWYWRWLYDVNQNIIGGNPNLIRPGQTFVLPG